MDKPDNQEITDPAIIEGGEGEQGVEKPTEQPSSQAPESYELKLPEGLEETDLESVKAAAKQLGLTAEQAQLLAEQQASQKQQFQQSAIESFNALTGQWLEQAKSDPEYGGDNFERNLQYATTALDKFATPEFKAALNESGYGNHPEMIRIFSRIGKTLAEDKPVGGEGEKGGETDAAKLFYPTMS